MTGNSEPESSDSLRAFGEVLKAFRKRADLTQEELAPRVRYSPSFVASVEQGRRLPPKEFIDRAEEALDAFGALRVRRGTCHGSRAWRPGSASGRGWRRRR
jgi:transcriptional regulator with XRE-family HTH domain